MRNIEREPFRLLRLAARRTQRATPRRQPFETLDSKHLLGTPQALWSTTHRGRTGSAPRAVWPATRRSLDGRNGLGRHSTKILQATHDGQPALPGVQPKPADRCTAPGGRQSTVGCRHHLRAARGRRLPLLGNADGSLLASDRGLGSPGSPARTAGPGRLAPQPLPCGSPSPA
jgi:hypothetical protein